MWSCLDNQEVGLEAAILERVRNSSLVKWFCADNVAGKGIVFTSNNVIDYAEGGVVSKELVHSNAGSVTLFSFDAGQGLSEHTAPFDAFIQVVDGKMELTVENIKHVISAGESFIIPSGAPHSVNAPERFKMIITMIRG